jgi:hypothetical protein
VCALFWAGALLHVLLAAFGALSWTTTSNAQFSYSMVRANRFIQCMLRTRVGVESRTPVRLIAAGCAAPS